MTAFVLIGAALTAVVYPVLFARRYPGRPTRVVIGAVVGLVAMLLWPVTLWVAVAMWLTGFTRPDSPGRRRRRVVFPLAGVGSLATLLVIGLIAGPPPASTPATPAAVAAVADIIAPTTTAAPITTTPPPTSAAPVATTTKQPTTTTTRPPVVTTTTPAPDPRPRPAPRPAPRPKPEVNRNDDDSDTGRRTGNSGHLCLPGERDGDNDGYCGEGR